MTTSMKEGKIDVEIHLRRDQFGAYLKNRTARMIKQYCGLKKADALAVIEFAVASKDALAGSGYRHRLKTKCDLYYVVLTVED